MGVAFMGILKGLERLGFMEKIQQVAGSSVGAITALTVCLRSADGLLRSVFDCL